MDPAAGGSVLVAYNNDEAVTRGAVGKPANRHREATLRLAVAPAVRDRLELRERRRREIGDRFDRRCETAGDKARHRLAHLANRTAFERELARVDDRLVAEIQRAEPRGAPVLRGRFARTRHAELQSVRVRERSRLGDQRRQSIVRTNGIARHEKHAALDAIAEKRAPVGAEEVLEIVPQLEAREGVATMFLDDFTREIAFRAGRARRAPRPEQCPGRREQRHDHQAANDQRRNGIVEENRAWLPG